MHVRKKKKTTTTTTTTKPSATNSEPGTQQMLKRYFGKDGGEVERGKEKRRDAWFQSRPQLDSDGLRRDAKSLLGVRCSLVQENILMSFSFYLLFVKGEA